MVEHRDHHARPRHAARLGAHGRRLQRGRRPPGQLPTREEFGEAWEFNYDEVFYGGKGHSVAPEARGRSPTCGPNWEEDQGGGDYPNSYYFYLPRICNHCTNPACVEACPRGAIYKREEDGIVLINEDRCHGYRFCMEACPYKKIYFNHTRKISQKCIFCFPRVDMGVVPACARMCPGRVRFAGYLDDQEGPIYKLVKVWKVAIPLHPEYGTEPNVYYVPPLSPPRFDETATSTRASRASRTSISSRCSARPCTIRSRSSRRRWRRRAVVASPS